MDKYNSFKQGDNILIHKRILDAPRELVWEVWTNPEHIKEEVGTKRFFSHNKINEGRAGANLGFYDARYGEGLGQQN